MLLSRINDVTMANVLFLSTLLIVLSLACQSHQQQQQLDQRPLTLTSEELALFSPLDDPLGKAAISLRPNGPSVPHFWQSLLKKNQQRAAIERVKRSKLSGLQPGGHQGKRSSDHSSSKTAHDDHGGIHVASWRWDEIGIYFTFTTFIIVAGLAKVAFHHAHVISSRIPESCLLILLGTAVGGILYAAGVGICEGVRGATRIPGCSPINDNHDQDYFTFPTFTPKLFFLILLPPIILESSYSLYDRAFADNLGTVLFYAVIGTLFNTFVIGLSLLGLVSIGWIGPVQVPDDTIAWWSGSLHQLQATDCLVFSSLISAVDPVAVLAIFQEVGINKDLYFLVFGESLLNDAVTVVLYTMMVAFATMEHISSEQIALGLASFFTVSFGGLGIGILCGLLTALITRTTSEVRVVEPLAVLGMAYFSYLSAELFHFSGIISTIGCGLVQAHYAFANVSHKSYTTVKYFIKMLSATSDAIIFLFLGMVLVNDVHEFHTGFILWVLFLCLAARFVGVFILTAIVNRFRLKQIHFKEQFIMAYGGLRGAVSFSLVEMLEPSAVRPRQMFVTTTLAVILFTVFIQGGTIKLFVRLLNIKKDSKNARHLTSEINETMIYHLTAGIEEICGKRGNNYFRERIEYLDEMYLRRFFTKTSEKNSLQRLFEKLTISEHYANLYVATGHTGITPVPSTAKLETAEPCSSSSEVEDTPLLPLIPLPGQTDLEKRITSRNPLVRQRSAPPSMNPPRAPSSFSETPTRDIVSNLPETADVQLRNKSAGTGKSRPSSGESVSSGILDLEATAQAFRKALRSSSTGHYKRVYQKYNRNLIGDDDIPELEIALRRRLSMAPPSVGRFSQAVIGSPLSSPGSGSITRNSELGSPIRQSSLEGNFPFTVSSGKRDIRSISSPAARIDNSSADNTERLLKGRTRPDSLRTAFAPLKVINERPSDVKEKAVLQVHDLEDEEDEVFSKHPSRGTKETGV